MNGKYVLITGGTGGLGKSVTIRCAQLGAHITLPYRSNEEVRRLKEGMDEELLAQVTTVRADLLKEQDILQVIDQMPGIDVLIHIMGGFAMGRTAETSLKDWQFQIDINLTSAFLMIRACLGTMQKQKYGRILTIGAKAAVDPPGKMAAYAAAKAGLVGLTRSIAEEVKDDHITANVVMPAVIDTPANREAMGAEHAERWVTPESLAKVITFLASEAASDISGALIPVYGRI
jgi:NAD(P)-dependent dehydrogenase (short-subunit alcohol dehydrogenase family)